MFPGSIVLLYSIQPLVFVIPPVDSEDKATPLLSCNSTVSEASGCVFPTLSKLVAKKRT
ncbi:hypothetical protein [Thalassobellus suaedae]|uniref:Uncharacterized protein n=1 Tax=Thalassobellus suaedae TaxID=3074124 RepID=A0ABY9XX22_9FLAO|nr:hypothetical protein RHP51_07330 [Flavobacteriaceae bacterium HL-DH14]